MTVKQAAKQIGLSIVGGLIVISGAALVERVAESGLITVFGGVTAQDLEKTNKRLSQLEEQRGVVPLPSPISLGGGSRFTHDVSVTSPVSWTPLPGYEEVVVDWRFIPENIEVYATVSVKVRAPARSQITHGNLRVVDVSVGEGVASFERIRATIREGTSTVPIEERESTPIPRQNGISTYRLEVAGDRSVVIGGYGYLRFRGQEG